MSPPNAFSLPELFTQLEAAIRAGDRARATELRTDDPATPSREAADRAGLERRVRALMAELDQPTASPRP